MKGTKTRLIPGALLTMLLAACASYGLTRDARHGKVAGALGTTGTASAAHAPGWALNDFVAVTQILSNVGVLIALVLTLRQLSSSIRQATNSAVQSNAHALNQFYVSLATSGDLASIYRRGREDPSKLTDGERARFFYACVAWFAHHEQSFGQVQSGLLPTEFFAAWELAIKDDLRDAGLQWYWNMEGGFFDAPFRKLIDRLISEIAAEMAPPAPVPPAAGETERD